MKRLIAGILAIVSVFFHIRGAAGIDVVQNGRKVLERTENAPCLTWRIKNTGDKALQEVHITCAGSTRIMPFVLEQGKTETLSVPFPPLLYPGTYTVSLEFCFAGGEKLVREGTGTVVAEMNEEAMIVLMWQEGTPEKIAPWGFTHHTINLGYLFQNGKQVNPQKCIDILDYNLKNNLRCMDLILSNLSDVYNTKYARKSRRGVPYPRVNIDTSNEEFRQCTAEDISRSVGVYGSHPALRIVNCNSERRDGSQPAFFGTMEQDYRKATGEEVPIQVNGREAPTAGQIPDFPVLKTISEDKLPLYRFYHWWWQDGDGWNSFHRFCREQYRKALGTRADDVLFFFDPAVRTPPIPGSGAGLDMLSQWTYSYYSPIKLATATDELRAMARLNGGQKLLKGTQAIWYRSPPAPKDKIVANPPAWVAENQDAPYISIAPDHLQESFWSKISRRLDGISYHGYGSLIEKDTRSWNQYAFTNDQSRWVLKKLIDEVVRPLGPVLKKVPERRAETAVLMTVGSNLFGTTGSWGWGWGTDADMHQILQRCHLDPEIIYDEDIRRGRLEGLRCLALPNCEIMDEKIIDLIRKFQVGGGIVIGDTALNPLILPDVTIDFTQNLSQEEYAKKILKALGKTVPRKFYADSTECVTHTRSWENADYLFTVNDRRHFGDYVGMYGNVKEAGSPLSTTLTLCRSDIRAVYNLVSHTEVSFERQRGSITMKVDFATNDGRFFLALPTKISSISVSASEESGNLKIRTVIQGEDGLPVHAILPIEVTVKDAAGRQVIGSGYYYCENGIKDIAIIPSANDSFGNWQITVRELASNKQANASLNFGKKVPLFVLNVPY